jgi:hypothetical protein
MECDARSVTTIAPLKIREFAKTTPTQIRLQVRCRDKLLLMVWDAARNVCKWKGIAMKANLYDDYITELPNAMFGYVAHHATSTFIYVIRDWETGNIVQEIDLRLYHCDQITNFGHSRFTFHLTSFVFIAHDTRELPYEWWRRGETKDCKAGTFQVFSISTGQLLYNLQCPAHIPDHIKQPAHPYFSHTDESEQYWFFRGMRFSEPYDDVGRVWVWDVIRQRWSVLDCKLEHKFTTLVVDEKDDGQWRLVPVFR